MAEQIPQLGRKLREQVLERAEADPQWRRQFIENPETATGEMPEARQLREIYESARPTEEPPEAPMPPTVQEEYRSLAEKVLERAASDPLWKQQLLDDPDAAIRGANFSESQRIEEMLRQAGTVEVEAHESGLYRPSPYDYTQFCTFLICLATSPS